MDQHRAAREAAPGGPEQPLVPAPKTLTPAVGIVTLFTGDAPVLPARSVTRIE